MSKRDFLKRLVFNIVLICDLKKKFQYESSDKFVQKGHNLIRKNGSIC
jgi:hypothetical protein